LEDLPTVGRGKTFLNGYGGTGIVSRRRKRGASSLEREIIYWGFWSCDDSYYNSSFPLKVSFGKVQNQRPFKGIEFLSFSVMKLSGTTGYYESPFPP